MTKRKATRKLPAAKDWRNRDLSDWNTTTFTKYLEDKHVETFGIDYAPFGGKWAQEQGIIGDLIGTASRTKPKPRTASNEMVKRLIDEAFETYKPTDTYPGTSLGFTWHYRKEIWQRIQAEELAEERRRERQQAVEDVNYDKLSEWF